jgi:hypothetical protein
MTREQAQNRNWFKGRAVGFAGLNRFDHVPLTDTERQILKEINELRMELLDQWDESSEVLSSKVFPKYKCHFCARRSNKEYKIVWGDSTTAVCRKHYLVSDEQYRIPCQTSERPSLMGNEDSTLA